MAGTFQVLWGNSDGEFLAAETLNGTDDAPLEIPKGTTITENICTRPFAADINGDGHLDIVSGNFIGSFYVFYGEGKGKFNPECEKLKQGKKDLMVSTHSDPFMVDWDDDGDLDLLSGSGSGGVFISMNNGTAKKPEFGEIETILPVKQSMFFFNKRIRFGDKHIRGPQTATRVWADDVNGDGKLDILIGDSVRITHPADGLDEDEARKQLKEWNKEFEDINDRMAKAAMQKQKDAAAEKATEKESDDADELDEAKVAENAVEESEKQTDDAEQPADEVEAEDVQEAFSKHYEKRREIIRDEMTGYVWVMYQK